MQIVGYLSLQLSTPKATFIAFRDWFNKLRSTPPLDQAREFVVCPESNLGWEAAHLVAWVGQHMQRDRIHWIHDAHQNVGVKTTEQTKSAMVIRMRQLMCEHPPLINFWHDLIAVRSTVEQTVMHMTYAEAKTEFMKQLRGFMRIMEPNRDPTKPPKIMYTGKMGGERKDDHVMALGIAIRAQQKRMMSAMGVFDA